MNKVSSGETEKPLHCTFCGKSQHEVRKLKNPSRSRILRGFLYD